jgi:hypothetical protein
MVTLLPVAGGFIELANRCVSPVIVSSTYFIRLIVGVYLRLDILVFICVLVRGANCCGAKYYLVLGSDRPLSTSSVAYNHPHLANSFQQLLRAMVRGSRILVHNYQNWDTRYAYRSGSSTAYRRFGNYTAIRYKRYG